MTRRMNTGMQSFGIGRMLAGTRIDTDVFDIRAHVDSSLHFDENLRNIQHMTGTSTRHRGREQHDLRQAEAMRERKRRSVKYYQVGLSNEAIDLLRRAKAPGKRTSRTGHVYYEHRRSHSDVPPTRL